ncbi:MAG: bifunctional folylpolyglutamate synthase/dihydrofolate synthase [bacterium]|nr:bifunctional folylpolyglutamate synthase/dihydrofolate synthase [bacterium]
MRVELAPARDLLARVGDPHVALRCVHVAGTKGKGSVCALVGAGLTRAGHTVGVYGSPHVERMNERIKLNGAEIEDGVLADALTRALDAREEAVRAETAARDATWFDIVTTTAFLVFAEAGVDWAVVEVGLGGRLDSTNVVTPEVCVVTSIALEHTSVLGGTRVRIAREKAGILKAGASFVCGVAEDASLGADEDAGAVLMACAAELGMDVCVVAPEQTIEATNLALARTVLAALEGRGHAGLGPEVLDERARAAARLPGRLERRVQDGIPVVLDGAHVPESLARLMSELETDPGLRGLPQVVLVLGRDKQVERCLKALAGRVDRAHCTSVPSGIHLSADELTEHARQAGLDAVAYEKPHMALAAALRSASEGWVLVTGSLYLVGALRGGLDDLNDADRPRCSRSARTSS